MPAARPISQRLLHAGLFFVLTGVLIYLGAVLWAGWAQTLAAIRQLGGGFLIGMAALASLCYLWRFARWAWCLRMLGHAPPWWMHLRVYVAGLALTTTPGKLGETFRSVLLLPYGVPAARSLGAFLADRASDVLGLCLLGTLAGGVLFARGDQPWPWLLTLVGAGLWTVSVLASYAVLHPAAGRFWGWLAARLSRLPVKSAAAGGQVALEAWASLWLPRRTVAFAMLACAAYGVQALVFAWICARMGLSIGVADAAFIFVNATLLGAASMVPGGLGAMEAALVVQLLARGVEEPSAVSVAIALRLVTLWTGLALGAVSLMTLSKKPP